MRSVSSYSTLRRTLKTLTDLVGKRGKETDFKWKTLITTTMAREGTILEATLTRSGRSFFGQIQSRFFQKRLQEKKLRKKEKEDGITHSLY